MTEHQERLSWYSEDFANLRNLIYDSKFFPEYKTELTKKINDLESDGYIKRGT